MVQPLINTVPFRTEHKISSTSGLDTPFSTGFEYKVPADALAGLAELPAKKK